MIEEKHFAVLIDSDNISSKYVSNIMDEMSNYGTVTYKRIYGDWTSNSSSSWKSVLLENSISPVQQFSYTYGKNATDSAMIIDAMDILYSGKVGGFCLVSSDSDFTKLASRLRESGMMVIGMGEKKTPRPFSAACDAFKYLDILAEDEEALESIAQTVVGGQNSVTSVCVKDSSKDNGKYAVEENMTNIETIKKAMINIIAENGDEEGINMAELGSRIQKRYPDFDVRNYGYTKLSNFLATFDDLHQYKVNLTTYVQIKTSGASVEQIRKSVLAHVTENGTTGVNLGLLKQRLTENYPEFDAKNYGYTNFEKFVNDVDGVDVQIISKNGPAKKAVPKMLEEPKVSKAKWHY